MKRALVLSDLTGKKAKLDLATGSSTRTTKFHANPYLSTPVPPEKALQSFLTHCRTAARQYLPRESQTFPITVPFCEVEVRLGILKVPHALPERRVTSSGAKHVQGALAPAFDCGRQEPHCLMDSGVSRSHFIKWTGSGLSEVSPLSQALGVNNADAAAAASQLKRELVETELVETVYGGYAQDKRVCFQGEHPSPQPVRGKMESKEKLTVLDLTLPAAPYDIRMTLSSEKITDRNIVNDPPPGWNIKRIKRRRSYSRRDKSIAWQIDITEVTTISASTATTQPAQVDYEIEMELRESVMLQIINENDDKKLKDMTSALAKQLWWILTQINPLADALDVEETLRDHPNKPAVQLALAQCGALKKYMDNGAKGPFDSPIGKSNASSARLANINFPGCMPVNFSRHNLEEIQRSPENAYFLSEKTDGVRHLFVFTADTAVLVDRAMRGKQPVPVNGADESADPFVPILGLFQPGTVLDGEVVMNRRGTKPRPIFIVFDVMATSASTPILHLPFEERLRHLRQATFRTATAARDMFDPRDVANPNIALPLVRKNFVRRTEVDRLLSYVVEERGMRTYRNGELHNHLTDGLIFQPNTPYVCGTDRKLLKWKYLDTMTIDIEILQLRPSDEDDTLRVGCMGEEQTSVDMTRHVLLPKSERMKLEADRFASGGRIAEVGFDPETGEWYYLTMRSDKVAPNHIGTVLGTMLELGECLTTDELRYRLSVPPGQKDNYRKDKRGMLKQMLDHQRKQLALSRQASASR